MPNPYFQFKKFTVFQDRSAMKVTTDACLFGAWCAEEIRSSNLQNCSLLDIGTGTGLLALMIAQKNKCIIDAVEIDLDAAQQAAQNINASPWKEKIIVHQKDILDFSGNQYTVIVSNPPFYENEIATTNSKKNDARHSNQLKLSHLFACLKKHLASEGCFYLLLPFKRFNEAERILKKEGLFIHKKLIVSSSPEHSSFRVMIRGGKVTTPVEEELLLIKNEQQNYSNGFVQLLKDYYLHL